MKAVEGPVMWIFEFIGKLLVGSWRSAVVNMERGLPALRLEPGGGYHLSGLSGEVRGVVIT